MAIAFTLWAFPTVSASRAFGGTGCTAFAGWLARSMCNGVSGGLRKLREKDMALVADPLGLEVSASPDNASLVGYIPIFFCHQCSYSGVTVHLY